MSVVVPLFNEETHVEELLRRLIAACRSLPGGFEIVAVNDGSRDRTLPLLVTASATCPELRVVELHRNYGHMPALSAGLALARGQAVVTMDGDLQDPPELIPEFVARWREGHDLVYGLRTTRNEGLLQRLGTAVFYKLMQQASEVPIPEQAGTFGLLDRRVVNILLAMPERHRFFAGLRAWAGGRQTAVPYARPGRAHGASRVGLTGLLRLARVAIFSFSKMPLRLVSLLAVGTACLMLAVGLTATVIRLCTDWAIAGWATNCVLIGAIGFVHSLALAVLAEYVAIIYDEIKQRPLFVVRQEYRAGQALPPAASKAS